MPACEVNSLSPEEGQEQAEVEAGKHKGRRGCGIEFESMCDEKVVDALVVWIRREGTCWTRAAWRQEMAGDDQ